MADTQGIMPDSPNIDARNFQPRAIVQLAPAQADAYVETWKSMTKAEQDLVRLEVMYNVDQTARVQATLATRAMQLQGETTSMVASFAMAFLVLGMLVGWHWRSRAARGPAGKGVAIPARA